MGGTHRESLLRQELELELKQMRDEFFWHKSEQLDKPDPGKLPDPVFINRFLSQYRLRFCYYEAAREHLKCDCSQATHAKAYKEQANKSQDRVLHVSYTL